MSRCVQCAKPATKLFSWTGSMGPQRATLCDAHAQWWWDTYRNTAAGQTLSIAELPLYKPECGVTLPAE